MTDLTLKTFSGPFVDVIYGLTTQVSVTILSYFFGLLVVYACHMFTTARCAGTFVCLILIGRFTSVLSQ